jgi:hypothetical protein
MRYENMPANIDPEEQKRLVKEAIKEWLDETYTTIGRWTVHGILAAALAGAVYLMLRGQGWTKA